jgi:NADPH2:quinone reductase
MRAVLRRTGHPGSPRHPRPAPGPGQVRITVQAATVNPVDLATRAGTLVRAGIIPSRPRLGLGRDVAGLVDEIGPGVAGFVTGDPVIGLAEHGDRPLGGYAEQITPTRSPRPPPGSRRRCRRRCRSTA